MREGGERERGREIESQEREGREIQERERDGSGNWEGATDLQLGTEQRQCSGYLLVI